MQTAIERAMGYEGCSTEIGDERYACELDKVSCPVASFVCLARVSLMTHQLIGLGTLAFSQREALQLLRPMLLTFI